MNVYWNRVESEWEWCGGDLVREVAYSFLNIRREKWQFPRWGKVRYDGCLTRHFVAGPFVIAWGDEFYWESVDMAEIGWPKLPECDLPLPEPLL